MDIYYNLHSRFTILFFAVNQLYIAIHLRIEYKIKVRYH